MFFREAFEGGHRQGKEKENLAKTQFGEGVKKNPSREEKHTWDGQRQGSSGVTFSMDFCRVALG